MRSIYVLNGPNLSQLGSREPDIYGTLSLSQLESTLGAEFGSAANLTFRHTEDEAELVSWIHEAMNSRSAVVLNPAAFTHYSYALRDACAAHVASGLQLVEVHLSNPHQRESFRSTSVISGVASGVISGFGADSYRLALAHLIPSGDL